MPVPSININAAAKSKSFKHISGEDECSVHTATRFGTDIHTGREVMTDIPIQC